jgi:hypothetical protein
MWNSLRTTRWRISIGNSAGARSLPSDARKSRDEVRKSRPSQLVTDTEVKPDVVWPLESVTVTVTVYVPVTVYTWGWLADVPPPRPAEVPSPKLIVAFSTDKPGAIVIWTLMIVCPFTFAGTGE